MPCPRPALTSLVPTSLALILALLLPVPPAAAQESRRPSHCIAIADATPGLQYLHKAAWTDPVPDYSVRIHYIAHASFMIQTRGGIEAVTDYNGFLGNADFIPDVVTMNHAHGTHWTGSPDPAIPHVLEGWGAFGEGIEHHLDHGRHARLGVGVHHVRQFMWREPRPDLAEGRVADWVQGLERAVDAGGERHGALAELARERGLVAFGDLARRRRPRALHPEQELVVLCGAARQAPLWPLRVLEGARAADDEESRRHRVPTACVCSSDRHEALTVANLDKTRATAAHVFLLRRPQL